MRAKDAAAKYRELPPHIRQKDPPSKTTCELFDGECERRFLFRFPSQSTPVMVAMLYKEMMLWGQTLNDEMGTTVSEATFNTLFNGVVMRNSTWEELSCRPRQ